MADQDQKAAADAAAQAAASAQTQTQTTPTPTKEQCQLTCTSLLTANGNKLTDEIRETLEQGGCTPAADFCEQPGDEEQQRPAGRR